MYCLHQFQPFCFSFPFSMPSFHDVNVNKKIKTQCSFTCSFVNSELFKLKENFVLPARKPQKTLSGQNYFFFCCCCFIPTKSWLQRNNCCCFIIMIHGGNKLHLMFFLFISALNANISKTKLLYHDTTAFLSGHPNVHFDSSRSYLLMDSDQLVKIR